jgi:YesN/AraC family two-component response regulator
MMHARTLLLSRNYKIKDVAKEVGYYNPRYFSDAFTKFYGKSPSEFLQQVNENSSQSIADLKP